MKKYKVSVQYVMTDEIEVEAVSLSEAIDKVEDEYSPGNSPSAKYLDDSFEVCDQLSKEIDNDNP